MPYSGPERRNFMPDAWRISIDDQLERRDKRMDRFEDKIDILIERQAEQAVAIQKLNDAIGNGIRSEVRRTMKAVETMAEKIDTVCKANESRFASNEVRIKVLEDFSWFRTWMNRFRDGVMAKILLIVFGTGALIGFIGIAERIYKAIAG